MKTGKRHGALFLLSLLFFSLFGCSLEQGGDQRQIIIDGAGILAGKPELMKEYREYNAQLFKDYHLDFRVVTTESDEPINAFANQAFTLFAGEEGRQSGRAILLVINSRQDVARLEVSMALEPIYTDIFTAFIEGQHMVRFFRDKRLPEGIFATTEKIYARAREAAQGQEFMAPMPIRSGGGGAAVSADIGRKELNVNSSRQVTSAPGEGPAEVLRKYIQARRTHNDNPELDIFSQETRAFFRKWTVTPVQMDNEVHAFSQCPEGETLIAEGGATAVILRTVSRRECCPYLFRLEEGSWKLDFATMNRLIGFNHKMQWHLRLAWRENLKNRQKARLSEADLLAPEVETLLAPFLFAFDQYLYDANGYPFD